MKSFAILIVSTLGFAATAPVTRSEGVPLAGLCLVAEEALPAGEVAAAGKNGNKSGKTKTSVQASNRLTYGGYGSYPGRRLDAGAPELVAVELR